MDVLGTYKDEPVILQSKRQRRTISCLNLGRFVADGYEYVEDTYFLQFPYIIFCRYPSTAVLNCFTHISFSTESISSLDTKMYSPPLPNTDGFAICGCSGDNVKESIQQFWQKSFKIGDLSSGEKTLCQMFGLSYNELNIRQSNIRKAFRRWEKLDLDSLNETIVNTTVNTKYVIDTRKFLLYMSSCYSRYDLPLKLMF
jgi:hypothetical protein